MRTRRFFRLIYPLFALGVFLLAVNAWVIRHPARLDVTSGGVYSLSTETARVLQQLSDPVTVTYFYDMRSRAMEDARYLLDQYAAQSPLLTVSSHDPTLEPALAREFDVAFAGTAIFSSGNRRVVVNTPGEVEFTNALIRVSSDAVGRICFTDGHVESNPFSLQSHDHFEEGDHGHSHSSGGRPLTLHERHGMGKARNALEVLGYRVEQRLMFQGELPLAGCTVVVVAGPQYPFTQGELQHLAAAIEGGTPALLLLEPGILTGIERILSRYGITLSTARVLDPEQHYWTDPATPAVSDYSRHRVTRHVPLSFFPGAAALSPRAGGVPDDMVIVPLVESSRTAGLADGEGGTGPWTLMLLASSVQHPLRLIVAGDGDFASNSFFSTLGNGQLFLNAISELADHQNLIDITPREYQLAEMRLTNGELRLIFLLTCVLGPLLMLALGLWQHWRRV